MKEYNKIQGIYKIDENTHKPIPEIIDYLLPMKNREREFTEKIDGTNIRVYRDGHKIFYGGRTDDSQIHTRLLTRLQKLFMEELFEQKFGETPVTLYGEGYGGQIQHGKRDYSEQEDFILFDVEINGVYLERENIEDIAKSLGLQIVPIVCVGNLELGIKWVKDNCLGKDKNKKQIEGVVGRTIGGYLDRLGKRIMVKIKKKHFTL